MACRRVQYIGLLRFFSVLSYKVQTLLYIRTRATGPFQDSCRCLITVIRRLQMVLNAAARFVVGAGKFQHITPVLRDVLHWLPVRQRILYKVAATAFDCIRGTGPAYFKSARQLQTSLVGHISVLPNATTCWFLAPELSSADGVFQLLHRPSGTLFRHTCARHCLVADSLRWVKTLRTYVRRV